MKLNRIEKTLMNNPLRSLLQRGYEAPLLERMGGSLKGRRILEIGCGRGVGTEIIFERFGAGCVHAIDVDPEMVELARARLAAYLPARLRLSNGDATSIEEEEASFDAVFDFAVIHHIPDWKVALSEISRVLKPGGLFFFEEVTSHALGRWFYRKFLNHPSSQHWFSKETFLAELNGQGIRVGENLVERFFGDFIIGVGQRA